MSTVARPISPVLADTPIARPSAKLCRPIAAAIVMPTRSACDWAAFASSASLSAASTVSESVAPPAIGGTAAFPGRIQRSSIASPALPAAKPPPSRAARPTVSARLLSPFLKLFTASSTIPKACSKTSTNRKASTPTANIDSATRIRRLRSCSRPNGSPR